MDGSDVKLIFLSIFSLAQLTTVCCSPASCKDLEIPVKPYSNFFHPPKSFYSPFGPSAKANLSLVKTAKIDLNKRTKNLLLFKGAIRRDNPNDKNLYYTFEPKLYCPDINQDEFWIYVVNGSKIQASFKYSRSANRSLIPLYVSQIPLQKCDSDLSLKLMNAKAYMGASLKLIEAANSYAKCHMKKTISYIGAQSIKTKAGRIIALNFQETIATDMPITFIADENSNKIIYLDRY